MASTVGFRGERFDAAVVPGGGADDPPALLRASGAPLARTWTGDAELDRGLAAATARDAARTWFGDDRATRPVVRALARSVLGAPQHAQPGRNANLLAVSVALAVDPEDATTASGTRAWPGGAGPWEDPTQDEVAGQDLAQRDAAERLAPDDLAAILAATLAPAALSRREPLRRFPRETLRQLVTGWTRRQRRDLALAIVRDADGGAGRFLALVARAADIADVGRFVTPHLPLPRLTHYLGSLVVDHEVPTRHQVLEAARPWRGRDVIDLTGGWQVRVPWNRRLLEREGATFRNCLAGWYRPIHLYHRLVATIYRDGQPIAAAEISASQQVAGMLGVADATLPPSQREQLEAVLIAADVVVDRQALQLPTTAHRLAARIACRAAVLTSDRCEPDPQEQPWSDDQRGDRSLAELGHRAALLTDAELCHLRSGTQPDVVTGWSAIGALLVVAGARDPRLLRLDGGALFRRTAMNEAVRSLRLPGPIGVPCEPRWLLLALGDDRLPIWQRDAFEDALTQHPGHRRVEPVTPAQRAG